MTKISPVFDSTNGQEQTALRKNLAALKPLLDPRPDGTFSVSGDNHFLASILCSEIAGLTTEEFNAAGYEVFSAVAGGHLGNAWTVAGIEGALHKVRARTTNTSCLESRRVNYFLPVPVEGSRVLGTVEAFGQKFKFCPFHDAPTSVRKLASDASQLSVKTQDRASRPYSGSWLAFSARGKSARSTFPTVAPAVDGILGLLLFRAFNTYSFFASGSYVLSPMEHPKWILFSQCRKPRVGALRFDVVGDSHPLAKPLALNTAKAAAIRDTLTTIAHAPGLETYWRDFFRLYFDALTAPVQTEQLFRLWRCLEHLSLASDKNGATKNVVARLRWVGRLGDLDGSGVYFSLRRFARYRNGIVHAGLAGSDVLAEDISIARWITEAAARYLLKNSQTLANETGVRLFLANVEHNPKAIAKLRSDLRQMIVDLRDDIQ